MKIAIIVNLSKEKAITCADSICELLTEKGARLFALSECEDYLSSPMITYFSDITVMFGYCDVAITVGGDGTIIHAAKYAACADIPLIGVNVGRLGFAADLEADDIGALSLLLSGDYVIDKRILLDIEVQSRGPSKHYLAVNDAVIAHGKLSKIVDFRFASTARRSQNTVPTACFSRPLQAQLRIRSPRADR